MIRDIPADYIIIGSKKSNLREEVDKYQKARGVQQVDIRAREIRDAEVDPNDFELTESWYETAHGYECFLQFENKKENKLAGFLRLRLPKENMNFLSTSLSTKSNLNWGIKKWQEESLQFEKDVLINTDAYKIDELLNDSALVRELHVYGTMKRVGEEGNQSQHTGMGKKLLARAEEIANGDNKYNLKYKKLSIIAGVGVREYYKKRGYTLQNTYMVKSL
jgi:elongator complex protein 3